MTLTVLNSASSMRELYNLMGGRDHRSEEVTWVGDHLGQEKTVTRETSGDFLISLFLAFLDGTLVDSMFRR